MTQLSQNAAGSIFIYILFITLTMALVKYNEEQAPPQKVHGYDYSFIVVRKVQQKDALSAVIASKIQAEVESKYKRLHPKIS